MREFSLPALYEVPTDGNLTDIVRRNAAQHPDVAVIARKVDGVWQDVDAVQFLAEVRTAAKGLIAAGIQPGDRVAPDVPYPVRVDPARLRDLDARAP